MGRNFLVLLLLFLVREAAPDTTGPDVDAVIDRMDQFHRYFQSGTNLSASDGLKDVMEDKVDVTEFFNMLGEMFTNGTIGRFENEKAGQKSFRRLYVNTNRTSVALRKKLAELFKTMNTQHGYDQFDGFWLNRLFPYDRENEPTLQAIRTAFRGIFSRSNAFYDELSGTTVGQLELVLPFNDSLIDGNVCYQSRLDELCSEWGWTNDFSIFSKTMQSLIRMVGPGCESEIPEDSYLHSLQLNIDDLARKNNFSGGESNRDLYNYKALVFFPANEHTEYCIRNGTRVGDIYSSMHNNVRYLVARYNRAQPANATRESTVMPLVPKIQQAFSEIYEENQCERLQKIDGKLNGALREFGAVSIIKCARKFVWYELGYRFFQAAWTNSVEIPTAHESDYSSKCGKIIVFP